MSMSLWVTIGSAALVLAGLLVTYFGPIGSLKEAVGWIKGQLTTIDLKSLGEQITKIKLVNFEEIFTRMRTLERQVEHVDTKLGAVDLVKMCTSVASLEGEMKRFWDTLNPIINALVKQPIHYRKDELMDKFPNLSYDELCELKTMLQSELQDLVKSKDVKILAYGLRIIQIDTVLHNRGVPKC